MSECTKPHTNSMLSVFPIYYKNIQKRQSLLHCEIKHRKMPTEVRDSNLNMLKSTMKYIKMHIHHDSKKTHQFFFCSVSAKYELISMTIGMHNTK